MKKFKELSGAKPHPVDYRQSIPESFSGHGEGLMMRDYKRRGVDAELKRLHPSRRRQCSDALEAECAGAGISMEHVGITIGTVLHGVDLSQELPDETIAAIRHALIERKVVFFCEQHLTYTQHKAFALRFGELEAFPFNMPVGDDPFIHRLTHHEDAPGAENNWHSDVTWRAEPSLGSILYMREAPEFGGDTLFSDSFAQFEGLPGALQERSLGQVAVHDFRYFRRAILKRANLPQEFIEEFTAAYPIARHPVIRTHPESGKQALFVNMAFTEYIEGMEPGESADLLKTLYAQAHIPEYQCRFKWERDSVAFWDNRACQHYAASDYWPRERIAERVTVIGDRPFYRPPPELER